MIDLFVTDGLRLTGSDGLGRTHSTRTNLTWTDLTSTDLAALDFGDRDDVVRQTQAQHSFRFRQEAAGWIHGDQRFCDSMREAVYQRR